MVGTKALRLRNAAEIAAEAAAGTRQAGQARAAPAASPPPPSPRASRPPSTPARSATATKPATGTTGTTGTTGSRRAGPFSLPITATGIGAEVDSTGKALQLTQGTGLGDYTAASTGALLGTTLAEKNGLKVGSTFTIEDKTFTVAGLFDAGTAFGNNALYVTLPTAQTLAALPGELSTMIVTVNSMENVDAAKTALQAALGSDKADVTQGQRNLETAVSSLDSVKNISFIAFVAALGTAGLIILLIMVMLVRERRREIGVLKAIGAPNRTIGLQFVLEALVLVALGSVVGAAVASFASGGIASALISSSSQHDERRPPASAAAPAASPAAAPAGRADRFGGASQLLTSVTASASPGVIAAGIAAVFGVAIIGALVPALLTARIRPIEVLRGE